MLIHLTPTFINPYRNVKVILEKLSIMVMVGDDNCEYEIPIKDLSLRNPYPNKGYYVACRKRKNKAFIGLLAHIEEEQINKFTVYEKWKTVTDNNIENEHIHCITFNLLDNKFNAVSQDFLLWQEYSTDIHKSWIPVNCTPKMEFDTEIFKDSPRRNEIKDRYHFNGTIKQRNEQYFISTMPHTELLERGKLLHQDRMPDPNLDVFNLIRGYMSDEEIKEMDNQMNKENAFLEKAVSLNLPFDFCQTVYSFLLSSFITPEGFYQVFSNVYSNDTVFEYLEKMVKNDLLIIDEQDLELGFDDTSFLTLNTKYDPSVSVNDNESDENETIQFALKALKQML